MAPKERKGTEAPASHPKNGKQSNVPERPEALVGASGADALDADMPDSSPQQLFGPWSTAPRTIYEHCPSLAGVLYSVQSFVRDLISFRS